MNMRKLLNNLTPAQLIVIYYLLAMSVSTALLSLPVALKPGVELSFMDALFTAASAVSVTGLTVIDISETFSVTGNFILMFVLQFGGIGIMTLGTFLWLLFKKKIGFKERRLIMADQNQVHLSGLVSLLKQVLILILVIELVGALVLGIHMLKYFDHPGEAFLHGLFMSVSATTNGGFDITGRSLQPYAHDYFIQFMNILLIILGAIGFPVLIEVKRFLFRKPSDQKFRFSLFAKLTSITFLALIVVGTIGLFALEYQYFFADKSWHESFFYSLFQSVSTRSGGVSTVDVSVFSESTLLFMSGLMFIGASPSSVGGGIRTTTFAINVLFLYYFARGKKTINIFQREICEEDVTRANAVTLLAFLLCTASTFILSIVEPFTLMEIVFEVCSAFGTVGLSMGITPELSTVGKLLIIALMFIGRVGLITFLFMIGTKGNQEKYRYPKERVIIG